MGMRGPSAALASPSIAEVRPDARPEPPEDLTEDEAAERRAVVDRLPDATGMLFWVRSGAGVPTGN
jgi:hypothetical protein